MLASPRSPAGKVFARRAATFAARLAVVSAAGTPARRHAGIPRTRWSAPSMTPRCLPSVGLCPDGGDGFITRTARRTRKIELLEQLMTLTPRKSKPSPRVTMRVLSSLKMEVSPRLRRPPRQDCWQALRPGPLAIPVIADRALQRVVLNALEPEWEARFEPRWYGSAARAQGALDIAELTALSWRILCIGTRRRGRADLPRTARDIRSGDLACRRHTRRDRLAVAPLAISA
jgi:hypothetical protein